MISTQTNGYRLVPEQRPAANRRDGVLSTPSEIAANLRSQVSPQEVESWISNNAVLSVGLALAMGVGIGWIFKRHL